MDTNNNSDTDFPNVAIGPMEVGYLLFSLPFAIFVLGIAIATVASWLR